MRAAMARVHGGIGGGNCAGEVGGVAWKHRGRAGNVSLVHHSRESWLLGGMASIIASLLAY